MNPRTPNHSVAVLEDDIAVRESLNFSLEIEGFHVRTFALPNDLLNDSQLPDHDCFLLDYHLPGTTGLDVLAEIRRRRPAVRAILMTGHPTDLIRQRAKDDGIALIEKPFAVPVLLERLRDLLGSSTPE